MNRTSAIAAFLRRHGYADARAEPLALDASFRRYLRLTGGPRPAVLMDAPPPEDVRPFVRIARLLTQTGLSVPEIFAADDTAGLLLEEDLGDGLISALVDTAGATEALFDAIVDTLVALQRTPVPDAVPVWDSTAMTRAALATLLDWWWPATFQAPAPEAARWDFAAALDEMQAPLDAGSRCFVHRDFFVGNLLWLPDRYGVRRVGILDFQDAALGHPAYDLASLLQDARREFPAAIEARAIRRYLASRPELDTGTFHAAYAACAAQRHLRVVGQWVRLARRDGRRAFLAYGPHTWRLLEAAVRHPAAAPLGAALDRWIPPALRGNPPEPVA